jgi:hypothetical protein
MAAESQKLRRRADQYSDSHTLQVKLHPTTIVIPSEVFEARNLLFAPPLKKQIPRANPPSE